LKINPKSVIAFKRYSVNKEKERKEEKRKRKRKKRKKKERKKKEKEKSTMEGSKILLLLWVHPKMGFDCHFQILD